MSRLFIKEVNNCNECPSCVLDTNKVMRLCKIKRYRKICWDDESTEIPDWCPLTKMKEMTKGELLKFLEHCTKQYRLDAMNSVTRNSHMNEYEGDEIDQKFIDALLVDFVNFVGNYQGLDYGLYTEHLKEDY